MKRLQFDRHHVHIAVVSCAVLAGIGLFTSTKDAEANRSPATEMALQAPAIHTEELAIEKVQPSASLEATLPLAKPEEITTQAIPDIQWQEIDVKSGDTLSSIFNAQGLKPQELHTLLQADIKQHSLKRIKPGQQLRFVVADGKLEQMQKQIDQATYVQYTRVEDGFSSELVELPLDIQHSHASGTIEGSFYSAGLQAGMDESLIMEMVGVFGWDIDFALDIRKKDSFTVIYEEVLLNGEKIRTGEIVAAEFINDGRSVKAVRFVDEKGNGNYYTPEGYSMRKAFLRSPVDFRRISSRFQPERYHPVLGKKRPHRGVDYAASRGTPIKASGDGKIIFRGTKGGYGRTVILQHGGKYTTLYAHLNSFKRGLGTGSRVKQGQVIGYVGSSGLATGPHLHYEFRVNGVHRNPLTVKLPNASPIPAKYKQEFKAQAQQYLARLDQLKHTQLAAAEVAQ